MKIFYKLLVSVDISSKVVDTFARFAAPLPEPHTNTDLLTSKIFTKSLRKV